MKKLCWSSETGGASGAVASWTRNNNSLALVLATRACDKDTADNQCDSGSAVKSPVHSSWPGVTVNLAAITIAQMLQIISFVESLVASTTAPETNLLWRWEAERGQLAAVQLRSCTGSIVGSRVRPCAAARAVSR